MALHDKNGPAAADPLPATAAEDDKFLQVLLHQMPRKLQQGLAKNLPTATQPLKLASYKKDSVPLFASFGQSLLTPCPVLLGPTGSLPQFQGEEWHLQWLGNFARQAQRSLDSCWQLLKDFGLNSYVLYRYFSSCYREAEDALERELRGELHIILPRDYPQGLLDLRQPPRLLFWRGQMPKVGAEITAIIGSRRADNWGLQQAWQEALLLQKRQPTSTTLRADTGPHWIVSGLALGCDSAAHKGAMAGDGSTLAVLPSGIDRIYPQCHQDLARRLVAEGGALVSEYMPQAPPQKWRFVRRDHLQAAISRRLLLVQSALDGGSMHAVQAALDIGRPVYALDGSETCWLTSKPNPEFTAVPEALAANRALLEQGLARPWRQYTGIFYKGQYVASSSLTQTL